MEFYRTLGRILPTILTTDFKTGTLDDSLIFAKEGRRITYSQDDGCLGRLLQHSDVLLIQESSEAQETLLEWMASRYELYVFLLPIVPLSAPSICICWHTNHASPRLPVSPPLQHDATQEKVSLRNVQLSQI